jgi:hypothetical protein
MRHAALTSTFTNVLASSDTLSGQSPSRAHRKPRWGVACGVLAGLMGALCFLPNAGSSIPSQPKEYISFKEYALISLDNNVQQYKCLAVLYGKESAWNPKAVGNLNGTQRVYGIPQGKSKYLSTLNGYEQIQWGLAYIAHRYDADTCKALAHWKAKGWH